MPPFGPLEPVETVRGLKCRECARAYPVAPLHVCEFCFGPLEIDYHYAGLQGLVTRERIAAGPSSIWRYRDLWPVEGEPGIGEHVGFTPLVRARNLGEELGVRENDSVCHPTWSFKDRVVAIALTKAKEFGFDTVAGPATGGAGSGQLRTRSCPGG